MKDELLEEPRKRGRPKGKGGVNMDLKNNTNLKKNEISRIIGESIQYYSRKEPRTNEEISQGIEDYFYQCMEVGQLPTVEDLSLSLGVTRMTIWNWETGKDPERRRLILRAKEHIAAIDAKLVLENKIPQVAYIFRAKNYFGMKDQQDVTIAPYNPLGEPVDIEALKQKYLDNTYGVMDSENPSFMLSDSNDNSGGNYE